MQGLQAIAKIPNNTEQRIVDSLFKILSGSTGTTKVDILNLLSRQLSPRTFDSSYRYADEALKLSKKLGYEKGEGVALFYFGNSFFFKSDIKNTLSNYHAALRILEHYEPSSELADLLYQLALVNQVVRNDKKVHSYFLRSARNYFSIGDTWNEHWALLLLGLSYFYELQVLKALELTSAETANRMMDSALRYNDICFGYFSSKHPDPLVLSNIYNNYALFHLAKNETDVEKYYLKALDIAMTIEETNYWRNVQLSVQYGNLGWYYYDYLKDINRGYKFCLIGTEFDKKTDRFDLHSAGLADMGEIEMARGQYAIAKDYFFQSILSSNKLVLNISKIIHVDPSFRIWGITETRSTRIRVFKNLVSLFELSGDYKKALEYQKKVDEEKSILAQDELSRQVIGLEAENDDNLKRQEIERLNRDNELRRIKLNHDRLLFGGIGCVILIASLVILLWLQRKRFQSNRKAMLLEQKLLRSQMNPHFLFNALTGIQNFIVSQKPDKASIYLSKFANLVRNILDSSVDEYVKLEKEINTIENYLELQKIRYSGKFDYRIEIDDEIDPEVVMIPPMLAQPFIENSIEHGIKHRETPGHIDIRFTRQDGTLIFEVEDNGIGREKAREIGILQDQKHRSMATSLTIQRLANLNRKLQKKIILEITDLKNALGEAAGTKVMFSIPVEE